MVTRTCTYCEKPLHGKRADARFCSATCRAKNYRQRQSNQAEANDAKLEWFPDMDQLKSEISALTPNELIEVLETVLQRYKEPGGWVFLQPPKLHSLVRIRLEEALMWARYSLLNKDEP